MANIVAARAEVQKVVAFLVNRFGSEAEVFEHLTHALEHLKDDPIKATAAKSGTPAQEDAAVAPTETVGTAPAELTTESEASTETTPSRRKR